MKITFLFALVLFSSIVFAQHSIDNMSAPTYNGSSTNLSAVQKIQDIKDKTQLYLSTKLSPGFIKRILKPGDSIEFNYELVIDKAGHPIPNKTKVNTESSYFNNKIIRFLNILPEFTPAIASVTGAPYRYFSAMDAEFFVDDTYQLTPIYRINLQDNYEIDTDDEKIVSLYDSINKNTQNKLPIKNLVYFSTSNNKTVTNIIVHTNNLELKTLITNSIQKIQSDKLNFYAALERDKNYSINSLVQRKKEENTYIEPDKMVTYEGCDENLSNEKLKRCMQEKLAKLIFKEFNSNLAASLGLSGRQKILISFKIDKNGDVTEARARAPHPRLKKEAIRVIKLIPKMKPASLKGEPVIIPFSLPIIFSIEDESPKRDVFNHRNSRRY